ncbi:MAG: PD-(D/E)XK nuclease family protein [Bacteroidales bacterium]|nr:PD-(D/E)XK nuclease family protein [Bacteroidales bacterium]
MKEFLRQVAEHYYAGASDGDRLCFVFPNRRATGFFKKYLGEVVARQGRVTLSPDCFTMNDFFARVTGSHRADRIKQLLLLHECYSALVPNPEPLDDFLYWGGVMLGDFDDVDKYLADPEKLWKNVEEFKGMQDLSFLSPDQEAAVKEFLGHFRSDTPVKRDFLHIWNILLPLYRSFNQKLSEEGLSYEGGIYRALADRLSGESVTDILAERFEADTKFVFTGLNALNECEKKLLLAMKKAGVAEFCWDFSSEEIRDPQNKSSLFMARNVEVFGQALPPDTAQISRPEVHVLSVPSSVGQAKQLPEILSRCGGPHGTGTAIVLPDEGLLVPVLNSIPEEIQDINVTMGYPVRGSEWMALLGLLGALQQSLRDTPSGAAFYHRQVWAIFSNGVFKSALTEEESERCEAIKAAAKFYIPSEEFTSGPLLEAVFRKAEDNGKYLEKIILLLAEAFRGKSSRAMELEFAMHSWKVLTRLRELNPPVSEKTWWRLYGQLLSAEAVPFKGEPLRGMQIMGPLETRALDFDNLVILSCNEGVFPRRSVASSFIPPELRKGFGLPTYEYQDAIWAYYFYRLIQRAGKVWLVFDSRTEGIRSGEESRFIKQLELLYGFDVKRHLASCPVGGLSIADSIPKTEEDLRKMEEEGFHLSASSIRNYLSCQASFYYSAIKGLGKPEEVDENLDAGMLGSVLHAAMHALYSSNPDEADEKKLQALESVSRGYLEKLLERGNEAVIREQVRMRIKLQLGAPEVTGRNLVYEEILCKYVRRILEKDLELLEKEGVPSFRILGLEKFRRTSIGGFEFVGFIDRIDSFAPGTIRVVDYKSGHVSDEELEVTEANAVKAVDALFGKDNSKRPGIALQMYLYDRMMEPERGGRVLLNSVYPARKLFTEGVRNTLPCKAFAEALEPRLLETLGSMRDLSQPWQRTSDAKTCEWCDFKKICGR